MSTVRLFLVKNLLRRVKSRVNYHDILFARRGFERVAGRFNNHLPGFTYNQIDIGGMKCEWVAPDGCDTTKVLLYFHGGGYSTGSINTHRALVSQIAKNAGIKALIIEYRLAPEHKYPAPIEDATKAYQWLLQNGFTPENIAFGGDSAGGGMVVCTLLYLRDHNIPLPKCAFALSPWLDHTMSGESYHTKKDIDPMLVAEGFPVWSKFYMGEEDPKSPYSSPIFHDLTGLPPIYVQVGEEEMLLDDSTRFAAKAQAEGVDVTLEVYPRKFHVFNAFWRVLPKAREANIKLGEFLKAKLAGH
ncbi:MAG TPA: alpha/beta hydrolase [Chitinophagales bacterium]|nr:alpha/beta hydrolase [Chitinophagales bacterium]